MDVESPTSGPTPGSSVPERFDHLSPELSGVLYPTLAHMRSTCPVARSDEHGGFWVVTDYEDVLKVAQDWDTFSSAHGLTVPPAPIATRNIPVEVDPPEHRVYKRLINRYFTPAAVAEWEDGTRALITRLIDDFIEEGHCEFMGSFARPLPARTFFEFALGAPQDDVEKVAYLASKSSTPNDPEAAACWKGLSEWITGFLDGRRADGRGGDVVDAVLDARIDGRPITHDEAVGIVQLLILGGLETTAGALGMMMVRCPPSPRRGSSSPARRRWLQRRSRSSSGSTRRSSRSAARPPATPSSAVDGSPGATRSSSTGRPPTGTSRSSRTPTPSTRVGPATAT